MFCDFVNDYKSLAVSNFKKQIVFVVVLILKVRYFICMLNVVWLILSFCLSAPSLTNLIKIQIFLNSKSNPMISSVHHDFISTKWLKKYFSNFSYLFICLIQIKENNTIQRHQIKIIKIDSKKKSELFLYRETKILHNIWMKKNFLNYKDFYYWNTKKI
jgi:hypothetical protein